MRWARIPLLAALLLLARTAEATPPPIPYCTLHPRLCYPVAAATRAHFLGMMQRVIRAVPKVPDYRCEVARREINENGYGRSQRRATPQWIIGNMWCFHRGTDPRKGHPEVSINFELSTLPAVASEGGPPEKQHDVFVYTGPTGIRLVFGKVRLAAHFYDPEQERVDNGPYLVSVDVGISAVTPSALAPFAGGFDRASISDLLAREEQRRKADPEAAPIRNVLP